MECIGLVQVRLDLTPNIPLVDWIEAIERVSLGL